MSLFKERSNSYRKIINLENTINSLKQQISSMSPSSTSSSLQEENDALKQLVKDLKEEITQLKQVDSAVQPKPSELSKASPKKRGRKKQPAPDSGE